MTANIDETRENLDEPQRKEPSLGPACLVVAILALAVSCAVCAFGSWFTFRDQYPLAQRGITQQLIPWVKQSTLAPPDRESIVQQLNEVLPKVQGREINPQQLSRLHNCLQDNPVLLWGVVQEVQRQARQLVGDTGGSELLTPLEGQALERIEDRLLRAAAERKLSRNDIEFALQSCAVLQPNGAGLEAKPDLTAEQIRQFTARAEQLAQQQQIPNEPYDKTPAEAFALLLKAALEVQ